MASRLIGLGGYAKAGKDAFADFLVDNHGWVKTYMSKALEEALLRQDPWVKVQWDNWVIDDKGHNTWPTEVFVEAGLPVGISFMGYKELHALVGYASSKDNYDVRRYLQKLGTEIGRDMCDPEVWIRWAFREVDELLSAGSDVAITGIRYSNEMEWVERRSGMLVWVDRPGYGPVNTHSSDNSLGPDDFQVIIHNDGTLDDLARVAFSAHHIGHIGGWSNMSAAGTAA